jgi:hypothetical protein
MTSLRTALLLVAILGLGSPNPLPGEEPKDKPTWKTLFDGKSLEGWKSSEFVGTGKVFLRKGVVVLEAGEPMTGITYARDDFPRIDYEVRLEARKLDGDDFFATTTFPVGEDYCSLVVGGWGGGIVGLSSLNQLDASMNETTKNMEFAKERWYTIRIRVMNGRIQAWINDEQVVDADTTDKQISIRGECRRSRPFGIATYRTTGEVKTIQVRKLSESEKRPASP